MLPVLLELLSVDTVAKVMLDFLAKHRQRILQSTQE
jgi:hypothetical protein